MGALNQQAEEILPRQQYGHAEHLWGVEAHARRRSGLRSALRQGRRHLRKALTNAFFVDETLIHLGGTFLASEIRISIRFSSESESSWRQH